VAAASPAAEGRRMGVQPATTAPRRDWMSWPFERTRLQICFKQKAQLFVSSPGLLCCLLGARCMFTVPHHA
jgi:hypothetical protein